jgi:VWFA-related protein
MTMKGAMGLLLLAVPVCAAGPSAGAQSETPQQAAPVFRSESNLVVLHVNVFDGRSDAVPDLPGDAFLVVEDGEPQTITFFSGADVPVAVGLVVDNSSSMIARHDMVVSGTSAFADSSHPEDEVFTIFFNEHIQFGLPPTVKFTTNQTLVRSTLTRFPAGGMTALHDAVVAGLEHLQESTHQKRVLIVLSDGKDNASQHSEDDMLQRVARSDAIIYAVSTGGRGSAVSNPGLLRKLAEESGGVAFFPRNDARVVEAFTEIASNIRRGYSLGYTPTNTTRDGRYRRIKVLVRVPGRSNNLKVNARDGYFAPRDSDGD